MKTEYMLQLGNRKLPRSTGIFNLPRAKTCPGRTSYCLQHCYSKKAEAMYKAVLPFRERMLTRACSPEFVQDMVAEIQKRKLLTVRAHESGDYFDQDYLNKWLEIAAALPAVTFYSYTKSHMLDFSKRPANFIVRGSIDQSTKTLEQDKLKALDGTAETRDPAAGLINPAAFECPGSCKTCSYCLQPGDVWFHLH